MRWSVLVTYKKRYEPTGLVSALAELGWESLAVWDDGPGKDLLCLFRRTGEGVRP